MKKRLLSLALLLALILPTACGETDGETKTTDTTDSQTTTAPVEEEYVFPRWDGKEFRVLNADDIYSMHAKIDPGVSNGDMLNDAEYNRAAHLRTRPASNSSKRTRASMTRSSLRLRKQS